MENPRCKIGVIGAGDFSGVYLKNLATFANLEVVALASRTQEKAAEQARKFKVPQVCTVDELLANPEIELVVNLTPPQLHGEIARRALNAGKSVFNEKPLAPSRQEGREIVELAARKGVLLGCAPDTFMGAGLQTCRRLIDEGRLGKVLGGSAVVFHSGPDIWHPNPAFFYEPGGGPLHDIGPYYVNALVTLLGPVRRVSGFASVPFSERVAAGPKADGRTVKVSVPTYVSAVLEFAEGPLVNLLTTFDVWPGSPAQLEIFGTENMLSVPRPSDFGGTLKLKPHLTRNYDELMKTVHAGSPEWQEEPLTGAYPTNDSRGIGVADMAACLGYPAEFPRAAQPRTNGQLAFHVLDIMDSILDAARTHSVVELSSTCSRPEPLY